MVIVMIFFVGWLIVSQIEGRLDDIEEKLDTIIHEL